ncbi:hypothetical protein IU414_18010 [Nocardia farcinica]|uniref:Bacterial mobilisation domain-containing protein n=1 Tax=Nocardia farcinica (strain IFM 10152) TaxID=247156 RepID=Q5YMG8_NOCFA|nr:hypothetical protein [Nocardia farcinica]BAD60623.1 hypothetical protein PNF1_980 [Nocardia farcinica IFM 10152]MBF6265511.1 hypothetical protein [Nocardia farcinica]MBF6271073.1 hypothetical protein [Nocardia farcinica]MBF6284112.1 hypothetical protein [Nocardia farcinica]
MPPKSRQGHRPHSVEKRTRRHEALFAPAEWALVAAAAATVGLKPGAFIAKAAVGAARAFAAQRNGSAVRTSGQVEILIAEVRELRRLLGNVAGNVNDVAKHANSTGELGQNADAVLAYTRKINSRIDTWLVEQLRHGAL